ncbi:septum site-determining protein MinD [Helicobacter cetorum]|uniref:Septum site-determining protein MinD n=1 Tax=Helicobacter cetorum (strain ATCC BAA-429 / MIT 00-7128) TaxID=182217 RepID=I0EMK6_HELC0|nr:septum site-determining protein MinD [Helicobacter cetorum]AFI04175.1 septum site-determining protein MinD [Helicobacter cetorum MIT 00-7128]
MAIVITITSGKGGVGKSTTTANLAIGLAESGKKVVAIDFDIGLRNLDMILGLENRIVYDVVDVMEKNCNLAQALITDKQTKNLSFLAASQSKDKNILDKEKVAILINALRADFDYILIDSPAGIESGFEHAILHADMALVVVTPEVSSLRDSDRVIGIIDAKSNRAKRGEEVHKYLIINRLKPELVENGEMIPIEEVLKLLGLPLIGVVPEDSKIVSATNKGEPVIRTECESSKAYERITRRILGEEVEFVEFKAKKGFFKALKGIFS